MPWYFYLLPLTGLLALLYSRYKFSWIKKKDPGLNIMIEISEYIKEGAQAFLKTEYKVLSIFVITLSIVLIFFNFSNPQSSWLIGISFLSGAFCSALAGYLGMIAATTSNVRTANAARKSLSEALNVAFSGGSIMGMNVVGLGILGLSVLFIFFYSLGWEINKIINVLTGFSFGASSIALFARVGGGIYTKAADVGADLAGKVYEGIPEDDPRNPATIADNVGDNVGDVAGMGADLFESYIGSIIASIALGALFIGNSIPSISYETVLLPLGLASAGIICSIVGAFFVRIDESGDPQKALNKGEFVAALLMIISSYFIIVNILPDKWFYSGKVFFAINIFWATLVGLISGLLIGLITEYYTSTTKNPVKQIANQSVTGVATNIIAGLGVGMSSTAIPIIIIAIGILIAYELGGLYGISIAALGMLSTTGIQLAVDAYGPISDNAGGIAEMSELPKEVRERTDKLDAVGNTTAAIGKGFAIGSAALTSLALFTAYTQQAGIKSLDLTQPIIISGLFVGAMLPYLFSSLAMTSVGKAAKEMIIEVGRQFKEIPGLRDGKAKADYSRCVEISTKAAIKEMIAPGLIAVIVPFIAGYYDKNFLAGILAGVTVSGVLLALFQSNAGGAWDNAKKLIESGIVIDGIKYTKGTEPHKASVVGDTVGDPLKDTSGPSLNILIKLMSIVALVIAPLIK